MTDTKGQPQPPLIDTVISDLQKMGHGFCFQKVDSRNYLLPQRRNRVHGCSVKQGNLTPQNMQEQQDIWKKVFFKLGLVPVEQCFDLADIVKKGLAPQPLQAPQDQKNWKTIVAKAEKRNQQPETLCMCTGTSRDRIEWASGSSTCIRPSHDVFYGGENRPLLGSEMLQLQGVFASDFEHPRAASGLSGGLARDFAGNAFTTTVVHAYAHGWLALATNEDLSPGPDPASTSQGRGKKRKTANAGAEASEGGGKKSKKETSEKTTGNANPENPENLVCIHRWGRGP